MSRDSAATIRGSAAMSRGTATMGGRQSTSRGVGGIGGNDDVSNGVAQGNEPEARSDVAPPLVLDAGGP
jgi:hypothetical protein